MAINLLFAGIAVADYERALAWYERLCGRPPDVIVNDHEAMWQMTSTGWIYVVGDAARAGRGLVTVLVDDLEGHLAAIAGRGLAVGAIQTLPGGARKATVIDPEGNVIGFGEVRGGDV